MWNIEHVRLVNIILYAIPTWSFHDLNITNNEDHVIMLINVIKWLLMWFFSLWVVRRWENFTQDCAYVNHLLILEASLPCIWNLWNHLSVFFVGGRSWSAHNYCHPFSMNSSRRGNGKRPTPLSCTFSTLLSSSSRSGTRYSNWLPPYL
jgi:hypothetical protein